MKRTLLKAVLCFFWILFTPICVFSKDYSLNLKTIYDFRSARYEDIRTNDEDHDFYQYVTFRSDGYGIDNLETFVSGRIAWDIGDTMRRDYFRDVKDTYSGSDKLSEIYSAWAEYKNIFNIASVKAGRQYFYGAEVAHFDGAEIAVKNIPYVDFSAFGGSRVSLRYEPRKNEIWGGNLGFKPAKDTRLEVRMVKYLDYSSDFTIYQGITKNLDLDIRFAAINEDPKDIDVNASYLLRKYSTKVLLEYYRRLGGSGYDDFDFDYTSAENRDKKGFKVPRLGLLRLQPFEDYYVMVHQPFLDYFGVSASYKIRNLINNNEGNQYNSDSQEYTAGLDCKNLPLKGSDILVEWRHYQDSRHSKRFQTESQEISGEFSQQLDQSFSSINKLFGKNLNNVSFNVRGFYRVYDYNMKKYQTYGLTSYFKGYVTDNLDFLVSYSYEEDDKLALPYSKLDYLQGVRVELGLNF